MESARYDREKKIHYEAEVAAMHCYRNLSSNNTHDGNSPPGPYSIRNGGKNDRKDAKISTLSYPSPPQPSVDPPQHGGNKDTKIPAQQQPLLFQQQNDALSRNNISRISASADFNATRQPTVAGVAFPASSTGSTTSQQQEHQIGTSVMGRILTDNQLLGAISSNTISKFLDQHQIADLTNENKQVLLATAEQQQALLQQHNKHQSQKHYDICRTPASVDSNATRQPTVAGVAFPASSIGSTTRQQQEHQIGTSIMAQILADNQLLGAMSANTIPTFLGQYQMADRMNKNKQVLLATAEQQQVLLQQHNKHQSQNQPEQQQQLADMTATTQLRLLLEQKDVTNIHRRLRPEQLLALHQHSLQFKEQGTLHQLPQEQQHEVMQLQQLQTSFQHLRTLSQPQQQQLASALQQAERPQSCTPPGALQPQQHSQLQLLLSLTQEQCAPSHSKQQETLALALALALKQTPGLHSPITTRQPLQQKKLQSSVLHHTMQPRRVSLFEQRDALPQQKEKQLAVLLQLSLQNQTAAIQQVPWQQQKQTFDASSARSGAASLSFDPPSYL
eukprot:CAMPEP_0113554926 /NCGR_PEP_ID=MMETSP0015_2-20120614/16425_1 /TAXON_ID=2838 /ORGANISM="Odontella" /LENGTH=559 /DNA_ID=CAMNT_0000456131 /DNA_START=167 /DNA_END=1846 /DNA_ORIENTATION=- /assembly_acc=CAM_ASM_000160